MVGELKAKLRTIAITGIQFNAGKIKLLFIVFKNEDKILSLVRSRSPTDKRRIGGGQAADE
jgi:hypothetical protein